VKGLEGSFRNITMFSDHALTKKKVKWRKKNFMTSLKHAIRYQSITCSFFLSKAKTGRENYIARIMEKYTTHKETSTSGKSITTVCSNEQCNHHVFTTGSYTTKPGNRQDEKALINLVRQTTSLCLPDM
jgi:hypothetical protein